VCEGKYFFIESLNDANAALKLNANNSKAYLRKGIALFSLEEFEAAKAAFEKGFQLDSSNSQFKTWIRKCSAEIDSEQTGVGEATTSTIDNSDSNKKLKSEEQVPTSTTPAQSNNPPTPAATSTTASDAPKIRHEWYQTPTHVFVTIFAKGVQKDNAQIEFTASTLSVNIKLSSSSEYQLHLDLCDKITPSESTTTFLSTKIEIKLKKANAARWKTLEHTGEGGATKWDSVVSSTPAPTQTKKKIGIRLPKKLKMKN